MYFITLSNDASLAHEASPRMHENNKPGYEHASVTSL